MRCFLVCALLVAAVPVAADLPWSRGGGSQITVTIPHDAQVKTPMQQVAFAEPAGKCADLLTDSLVADFATSGAVVIDRINFKRIMAEHKLNLTGAINEKTAAKIGRLIGAGSLVFVKVHDCTSYRAKENRNSLNGLGVKRTQVPTTRGSIKASIQIVNLTTGVTAAAKVINAAASLSADEVDKSRASRVKDAAMSFFNGAAQYDEYPADEEMQTLLFADAVQQVHRLLFPWTETRQFLFYDDSECSLQAAYRLMQNADYAGAAREAQASLDTCKSGSVKPVTLARAHYNRAMTYYMADDYGNALTHLAQAVQLAPNKVFTDAIAACNRSRSEALARGDKPPQEAKAQPKMTASAPEAKPTPEERLRRLDDLHNKKLISDEEYARRRKEILAEL